MLNVKVSRPGDFVKDVDVSNFEFKDGDIIEVNNKYYRRSFGNWESISNQEVYILDFKIKQFLRLWDGFSSSPKPVRQDPFGFGLEHLS